MMNRRQQQQNNQFVAPRSQSSSSDLNYEEVSIGERKVFRCLLPDCGKTFKFKSEMKRHQTIHSGERPHVCSFPDCGKTFKRADALSNHFRIHSGKTPFDCPVTGCDSQFNTKSALRYHLLKHKGEKAFRCSHPGCGKAFLTFTQLKQHEKASYYHQKVDSTTSQPDQSVTPQAQSCISDETCSIPSRETPKYENNNEMPPYEQEPEPEYLTFDFKYEDELKHEEVEVDQGYYDHTFNTFSCIKRVYSHLEEKPEETTAGTPEYSAISSHYSRVNSGNTMMGMMGMGYMVEDLPLQKKVKPNNCYFHYNFGEKIPGREELEIDSFFKKSEAKAEETQGNRFGTLFLNRSNF